jgi:outer membrane protein
MQHAISLPLDRTNAFINNMSLRGIVLDYRYHPSPKTGVGLTSGWVAFFDSKMHDTHDVANGMLTVSGKQYRYLNSVPLLFAIDHYIHPERILSRFIGLGIGTTYNRIDKKTGPYQTRLHAWQPTIAPEAGVRIGYDFSFSTYLSLRYTYSLETNALPDQSYLSVNIGIMHR